MAFFEPNISFRKQEKGGDIQPGKATPQNALTRGTSVLLLIHGYNVTQQAASDAYEGWTKRQTEINRLNANVVGVYWPADRGGGNSLLNATFYMQAIPHARATAPLLADALRTAANLIGSLRVRIIAHSLGARVTMELIDNLRTHPQANLLIERFVVMAAAVATRRLGPNQPFRSSLELPTLSAFMSLFSGSDPVLRFAFGPGEALAGGGLFVTALGHERWSGTSAIAAPRLVQNEIAGAHHGDYWAGENAEQVERARKAALFEREFLDLGPAVRLVPAASTPTREVEPARAVDTRGTTPARSTPTRAVAA